MKLSLCCCCKASNEHESNDGSEEEEEVLNHCATLLMAVRRFIFRVKDLLLWLEIITVTKLKKYIHTFVLRYRIRKTF